jgi:hypothetical protein
MKISNQRGCQRVDAVTSTNRNVLSPLKAAVCALESLQQRAVGSGDFDLRWRE